MGRAAEAGADRVYLTSDNPRSENPLLIIADALAGVHEPDDVVVEPDRRRAIELAISRAASGDVVLIAGKGHEKTQTIGSDVLPFDDVAVAAQVLEGGNR
jgi:UDP-N-acetylmuramyl tripeptide synthase